MKKLKPSTPFQNPSYAEVGAEGQQRWSAREAPSSVTCVTLGLVSQMKDEKPAGSSGDSTAPEPSPFAPPTKPPKRDRPSTFSPTEDSFKDTATLVKEDSDV